MKEFLTILNNLWVTSDFVKRKKWLKLSENKWIYQSNKNIIVMALLWVLLSLAIFTLVVGGVAVRYIDYYSQQFQSKSYESFSEITKKKMKFLMKTLR